MTNQEAIVCLEELWDYMCFEGCQIFTRGKNCSRGFICCNDGQALQEAIFALQAQDLQSTCNQLATDTISRMVAIDALCRRCDLVSDDELCTEECNDIKILKMLPSAQPEIIHCRDCKNCQIDSVFHDYWCDGRKVWKDHYCGYAERRTDE